MTDSPRNPLDGLLTYPQAARALQVSLTTIHRMVGRGDLARTKIGGRVYVHIDAIRAHVEAERSAGQMLQRRRAKQQLRGVG